MPEPHILIGALGTAAGPTAADVADYLRAHPRFLAEMPDLYRALVPPVRVHGEVLADHMAALLGAERAHAHAMASRADGVLAAGRAAAGLTQRVQAAVIALMGAGDIAECIATEFPVVLAIDAAALCIEAAHPGARVLAPGAVALRLGGRAALFRAAAPADPALHGEAVHLARHEALVGIPGIGPPALLALAARNAEALDPVQGLGALVFLGRAVAAALGR